MTSQGGGVLPIVGGQGCLSYFLWVEIGNLIFLRGWNLQRGIFRSFRGKSKVFSNVWYVLERVQAQI